MEGTSRKGTTMTGTPTATRGEAMHTWITVVQLLFAAADRGFAQADTCPAIHSLALGAHLAACGALALVPDDLEVDARPVRTGEVGQLVAAAEEQTRRHPIEAFPVGASGVVVAICDLAAEASS
jgi:hypothetical protein